MEQFFSALKDYCLDNIKIEFGRRERNRITEINEALEILVAANEAKKLEIVKNYYIIIWLLINSLKISRVFLFMKNLKSMRFIL